MSQSDANAVIDEGLSLARHAALSELLDEIYSSGLIEWYGGAPYIQMSPLETMVRDVARRPMRESAGDSHG